MRSAPDVRVDGRGGDWNSFVYFSVRTATAQTMIVVGDAGWDGSGMPDARLAVLPGTTHYDIFSSPALASAVTPFLDAPMPEDDHPAGDGPAGGYARSSGDEPESDLPGGLARPARRALAGAGYVRLEQFTGLTEAEVLRLHGMGPRALDQIRRALAARGQSFADR